MKQATRSLEDLRREIDEIDDAIHDLVMRRTDLLSGIAAAKGKPASAATGAFLRPGREATVLRRLVARHRGAFPKPALVRLWREIISAPLSLQGAFTVAVYAPKDAPGYWDLARDHYGSCTHFSGHGSASQVIAALGDGNAAVGILPAIQGEDSDPWWRLLARQDRATPSIIARLPFAGEGNARGEKLEALVVGAAAPEKTGNDHSYLAFETEGESSRAKLSAELKKAGLDPCFFAGWRAPGDGHRLYLVEVGDFVAEKDARIATFTNGMSGQIDNTFRLGAYAVPFGAQELAPTE